MNNARFSNQRTKTPHSIQHNVPIFETPKSAQITGTKIKAKVLRPSISPDSLKS